MLTGGFHCAPWVSGFTGLAAIPVTLLLIRRAQLTQAAAIALHRSRRHTPPHEGPMPAIDIAVITVSGAALRGSPLSGGYAGAEAVGYLTAAGPVLTGEQAGTAITSLITDPGHDQDPCMLTAAGLTPA
jgi:hypothetical protein